MLYRTWTSKRKKISLIAAIFTFMESIYIESFEPPFPASEPLCITKIVHLYSKRTQNRLRTMWIVAVISSQIKKKQCLDLSTIDSSSWSRLSRNLPVLPLTFVRLTRVSERRSTLEFRKGIVRTAYRVVVWQSRCPRSRHDVLRGTGFGWGLRRTSKHLHGLRAQRSGTTRGGRINPENKRSKLRGDLDKGDKRKGRRD